MATYDPNAINQLFQQYLGRYANDSELKFLEPYVKNGYITPYEIGQYIQGTPEAQAPRLEQYGQKYAGQLTSQNNQILDQAAKSINGNFAELGRGSGSSGMGNSLLQAGQQLAAQQAPSIAQFYGGGYGNLLGQYQGNGAAALDRGYGLKDAYRQHAWDVENFGLQQNAYNDYLNSANRRARNGAWGSFIGGGLGAAIGGFVPGGGMAGAKLGAGLGSMGGGLFGN